MKRQPTATWIAEDTIEERASHLAEWGRFEMAHNGPSLQADTATHLSVDSFTDSWMGCHMCYDENCTCPE